MLSCRPKSPSPACANIRSETTNWSVAFASLIFVPYTVMSRKDSAPSGVQLLYANGVLAWLSQAFRARRGYVGGLQLAKSSHGDVSTRMSAIAVG